MTTQTLTSIKGYRMRLTALDACGTPVDDSATCRTVVTDGFIRASLTGEFDPGPTYQARDIFGRLCINDADPDQLTKAAVSLELCSIDPDALLILTGDRPLIADGSAYGMTFRSERNWSGFALEVWTRAVGRSCDNEWGYFVLPFCRRGRVDGGVTIENGTMTVSVAAQAFPATASWATTPYLGNPLGATFPTGDVWGVAVTSVQPPALENFSTCGTRLLESGVFWIDADLSATL